MERLIVLFLTFFTSVQIFGQVTWYSQDFESNNDWTFDVAPASWTINNNYWVYASSSDVSGTDGTKYDSGSGDIPCYDGTRCLQVWRKVNNSGAGSYNDWNRNYNAISTGGWRTVSQTFDFTNLVAPIDLKFRLLVRGEPGWHEFRVTVDGVEEMAPTSEITTSLSGHVAGDYSLETISLDAYAGDASVTISFEWQNDDFGGSPPGPRVDAIVIEAASVLPVKLTQFKSLCNLDGSVDLKWQTASEQNAHYFEIQRSSNGDDWDSVGVVNAHGNTSHIIDYAWKDPFPARSDVLYYRIKQVDFDGKENFYGPVSVKCRVDGNVNVFPNPTSSYVSLVLSSIYANEELGVKVTDATGKIVHQEKLDLDIGTNNFKVDLSTFETGVYFFHFESKYNEYETIKVAKS